MWMSKRNGAVIGNRPGLILLLLLITLYSCNEEKINRVVKPSFYYWKSVFKLSAFERQRLDSLEVKTIYLKFFDVDWDASSGKALPVAKLLVTQQEALNQYLIIPTVFLTNGCLEKTDSTSVVQLAGNVFRLIKGICNANNIKQPTEIQIDCDWTVSTRDKYFLLLRNFKQLSNTNLSVTIRLHQVKYLAKSGIPPADRGLLMCYNMGNLKNPATVNSIIETAELKKYIGNLSTYPLPLDIALPLFDWKVLFRNNIYSGLIQDIPSSMFAPSFSQLHNNHIKILKDTLLAGYDLKKGDELRIEDAGLPEIINASKTINQHLQNTHLRVSLYHLDSLTLNKFTTHELEGIYSVFR